MLGFSGSWSGNGFSSASGMAFTVMAMAIMSAAIFRGKAIFSLESSGWVERLMADGVYIYICTCMGMTFFGNRVKKREG